MFAGVRLRRDGDAPLQLSPLGRGRQMVPTVAGGAGLRAEDSHTACGHGPDTEMALWGV